MWRTLAMDEGKYRGVQCVEEPPNKDSVTPGSTLGQLYEQYGLVDASMDREEEKRASVPPSPAVVPPMPIQRVTSEVRQPVTPEISQANHINLMLPSLARGGAERSVVEILQGLAKNPITSKLFVLADTKPCYDYKGDTQRRVFRLHSLDLETKMRLAAFEILASPTPVV